MITTKTWPGHDPSELEYRHGVPDWLWPQIEATVWWVEHVWFSITGERM